ncbi:efflux RND transporter periplasmic adaptor subunit [Prolixibacter denitrificans]|uniref:Hemolysin D n=1 Tax=Prolixibacter denitrificans TaxID=1541063 RepID=A0A2P8CA11_9BACT|nr:efflux RND transporter periplasmic adaptor subunit [Prolixibacter denitrificans]PSK81781.1 membrane fusion protein (multidrug efflux system) [Prolixibacter denitrificans]GET21298.1 hemolysin D [Prolixibacter denitrificans]
MKKNNLFKFLSFIAILATTISCSNSQKGGQAGMAGRVGEYNVMKVEPQSTTLYEEYPTNLQGIQTVEIRPKIAGYIQNILVDEGSFVKKGQVLFRINDNDIRATVRSAQAQVKVAEADIVAAKINLDKTKPLVEKGIVSKFDLESSESTLKAKEAQLAQAKANLANAQANLQYATITSPTNGFIGNFPYRVGSLVSSTISQPLTTISNTTEMYAYFSMNEKEFLTMVKGLKGQNMQEKMSHLPDVSLILADNSVYKEKGRIQTASGLVDPQTGAVNIRATFPNKEGILRSGGSGSVRIPQHVDSVIIVPQNATYELQGKHFIYTVDKDNKVHPTEIDILVGNLKTNYVVTSGLKPGDEIVVEGIASLRNNMPIKPKLVTDSGTDNKQAQSSADQVNK